jgi:hypothetical protein
MRPWTIILSSGTVAIGAAAVLAASFVKNAPASEIGMVLLPHLPALAVVVLGVYGLGAVSLTTTSLVAGMLRMRQYLARAPLGRAPVRDDWLAKLAGNGLRRLVLGFVQTDTATANESAAPSTTFTLGEVRSEIARSHYISLARSHFLSVLIVLIGIVGLGVAQDHGALSSQTGTIPTVSAMLIVAGLVLLAVLGRVAVDVTAEPLLEAVAQPPAEPVEVGLLRRVVALLEAARDELDADNRNGEQPAQHSEQLPAAFEHGFRLLLDAVNRLSQNGQALEAAMRTSIKTLETIRSAAEQQRLAGHDKTSAAAAFPELQGAVEELTAELRRLSTIPERVEETGLAGNIAPPKAPTPGLARELGRLLQEIEATR